ncbi:RNA-binding protein Raly-like [Xyrauchen texanus]|uniref:RNA-binding protein Raly-like n=1 Tax=Xyrauchen texanus TaxID=154827 RepID=UPI002241A62C|nr:RNA-binding protein Raly-like [Xyrauchen texanus]
MTLFKSEYHNPQYMSMTEDQKSTRSKLRGVKRPSSTSYQSEVELDCDCYQDDLYDRVYNYQHIPSTVSPLPYGSSLTKQLRSTSSMSSLHSQKQSRDRPTSRSSRPHSSNRAMLKMEELQLIKRELTEIKVQVDGLLDSLDRMDRQRQETTDSPLSQDGSLGGSLSHPSVSSPEASPRSLSPHCRARKNSPELGEASDDNTL